MILNGCVFLPKLQPYGNSAMYHLYCEQLSVSFCTFCIHTAQLNISETIVIDSSEAARAAVEYTTIDVSSKNKH